MSRRSAPRQASAAFRAARQQVAPRTGLAAVQEVWREIAGEYLGARSTPVSERAGTVTVECSEAVLTQELDLMQDQLLERLRAELGERSPKALKFRLGDAAK